MNEPVTQDYKQAIKDRVKELGQRPRNPLTLKKLARHLETQYTYLSRVLNSSQDHMKEDVLFEALHFLEFPEEKIEILMNARILQASTSPIRREQASKRLTTLQSKKFSEVEERGRIESKLVSESAYLLDPLATVIFVSLGVEAIKNDPRKLLDIFGIKRGELLAIMDKIEAAGLIERGEGSLEIKKLISPRLHYRPDHHFMRLHQQQIKFQSLNFIQRLPEERKKAFMVTFAADTEAFEKIKEEFNIFIGKVEGIAKKARPHKVYQLSFDLFDWL